MTRLLPVVLILLLYAALAGRYALTVPLFEAPDEYYHFAVVEHLARTGEMPPRVVAPLADYQFSPTPWRQMTYHAPLYYRLVAGVVRALGISTHDFPQYRLNPHAQVGIARAADNVNFIAHTGGPALLGVPQRDPTTDTGAAARVGRSISLLLGALTLAATAALGRALAPARPLVGVLAPAIIALTPQFLFLAGVVSNDALLTALCAWLLAAVAWYTLPGAHPRHLAAGMLVALPAFASLSKASGLATVPLAAGALLVAAWQGRVSWLRTLALCAALGAVFAVVAAPWYLENARLLGDFTATSRIAEATGLRGSVPFTLEEARGLYYSFWGVFGWFNLTPDDAFFAWVTLLCAGGAAGALWRLGRPPVVWALYAGYALLIVGAWWSFNSQTYAAQGRLFYPLLPLMAVGLAWGWAQWPRLPRWLALGPLLAGMLAAAALFPAALIQPAYTPSLAAHTPPPGAAAFHYREPWQEQACLTLWVTPPDALPPPGEALTLQLAWRAECPTGGYWSVFVHVVDPARQTCQPGDNRHVLAQADSMPQGGRLPLPALPTGVIVADAHTVVMPEAAGPLAVQVGLYDAAGTFMRAFAAPAAPPAPGERIGLSRCGAEIIQVSAGPGTDGQ